MLVNEFGEIALSLLQGATMSYPTQSHHHHYESQAMPLASNAPMPECGFIKAINEGEGFRSVGWRFWPDKVFNHRKLFSFLTGLHVDRMKAVSITDAGIFGYNITADALTEIELDDCIDVKV